MSEIPFMVIKWPNDYCYVSRLKALRGQFRVPPASCVRHPMQFAETTDIAEDSQRNQVGMGSGAAPLKFYSILRSKSVLVVASTDLI